MDIVISILDLFAIKSLCDIKETMDSFEISTHLNQLIIPKKNKFNSLKEVTDRWILDVTLYNEAKINIETISCNDKSFQIDNFIDDLTNLNSEVEEGFSWKIRLNIMKNSKNPLNIYNLDSFYSYLNSLNLTELLNMFNAHCKEIKFINILNSTYSFNTAKIYFGQFDTVSEESFDKKNMYSSDSNFLQRGQYSNLSLETFRLIERCPIEKYNILFDKLNYIFFLINICNFTFIDNDNFSAQIEGYKLIKSLIEFKNFTVDLSEVNLIYDWVYSEEAYTDKLGLARNVITLSLENDNLFLLKRGCFNSIKSNFKIYLKDNIGRYIEVKNLMSNYLFDLTQKGNDYCDSFANNFKANLASLITFFITVIILNSVSGNGLQNIFTKEIAYISFAFIIISFVYLLFLRRLSTLKIIRFKDTYNRFKRQYSDLLNEDDINRILDDDNFLKEDTAYIKRSINTYSWAWISSFFIFFLLVYIISFNNL